MPKPSVGRIVHYVSYGTPGGEYQPECRASIIAAVPARPEPTAAEQAVDLVVLNPSGMFFNQHCKYDEGAETPGSPDCPVDHKAGPHRYCPCGWQEAHRSGGTWHWPERVEE